MPQVDSQRLAHLCGIFQSLKGSPYVYETSKEKIHLGKAAGESILGLMYSGQAWSEVTDGAARYAQRIFRRGSCSQNNHIHATGSDPPYLFPSADSASQCLAVAGPGKRLCSMWSWNSYEGEYGIQENLQVHFLLSSVHHTRRGAALYSCLLPEMPISSNQPLLIS